jgi:hypothetical protein
VFDASFEVTAGKRRTHKVVQEPRFAHPPIWIHESLAAILGKESPLLISRRREAKRRALLQMLDRLPIRSERAVQVSRPAPTPAADIPPTKTTPDIAPRAQK